MPGIPREYFKGCIWHREPLTGPGKPTNYRYVIAGMLVSEKPIPELEDTGARTIFDGPIFGIGDLLACIPKRDANFNPGDADSVLTSLEDL